MAEADARGDAAGRTDAMRELLAVVQRRAEVARAVDLDEVAR